MAEITNSCIVYCLHALFIVYMHCLLFTCIVYCLHVLFIVCLFPDVISCGLPWSSAEEGLYKTYTMVGMTVWVCPHTTITVCPCVHMV